MAEIITDEEARTIASWWHGGQSSPLYSFVSTGRIFDLAHDIDRCLTEAHNPQDQEDLRRLTEYVSHHGQRGPQVSWSTVRLLSESEMHKED